MPIELGAEFIHGLPPELLQLADEAALTRFELDGEQRCYQQERLGPCGPQLEVERIFDQLSHLHLTADGSADRTFQEFLVQAGVGPEAAARATSYVEGFNAADARRISLRSLARQQEAEDVISGDRLFRIVEGYAQLPAFVRARFLAAGGELFLSTVVRTIEWKPGSVTVSTLDHRVFRADAAVITLPLGVLQANSVAFTPAPAVLEDAGRLAMGPVARVVYEFDQRFTQLEGVSFLFAPGEIPPTWWTTNPKKTGVVTAWMGGAKVAAQSLDQLPAAGLVTLARLLSIPLHQLQQHLVRWHWHNWQTDPQSVGAYTYVPAGAIDASDRLSIPVEGTLFFAGEHTDTTGHWGTVHGALRSGYRAAEQWLGIRA